MIYYFAYGSNMSKEQMRNRGVSINTAVRCKLPGYRFLYNKESIDGSSKANIEKDNESVVHGVCFLLDQKPFEMLKGFEKGYTVLPVTAIDMDENPIDAETFISESTCAKEPQNAYVKTIIKGALEHNLPESYIIETLSPKFSCQLDKKTI